MKRDRTLLAFIFIILFGIILIFLIYSKYFNSEQISKSDKLKVPSGYRADIILKGLKNPTSIAVDEADNTYVAENVDGKGRIIKYSDKGEYKVIVDKLSQAITNLSLHRDVLYISQRGAISKLEDGQVKDIVNGLPSIGDYSNNGIAFGYDGMIYVCQGSATNSGVVGLDNYEKGWLKENPYFHDYPPLDSILGGLNFKTKNPLSASRSSRASTGAFLPFNTISLKSEAIKGRIPGNACIMRISPYGIIEDTFAWGIRNPVGIVILPDTRVVISVQGMENRGSRPIANGKDYIYEIKKGAWLGWPDYEGGEPVVLKKFKPKNETGPRFIMELHPSVNPPKPLVSFNESGRIGMIDVCYSSDFGYKSNIFIPLKKGVNEPAKIVSYDIKNNKVYDFMTNSQDSGLLADPTQCVFSKSGKLYVLESSKGLLIQISKEKNIKSSILPGTLPVEYFVGVVLLAFIVYLVFSVRNTKK